MVAALLKIVSTGMQDEYLQPPKDQPQLSAFMTVLVKAGRFGTQWVRVDFDTKPDFGTAAVARLPVQGELISKVFLVTEMPDIYSVQRQAYNYIIPKAPANPNYGVQYLFGGGEYKSSVTYIYIADLSGNLPNFQGLQLEGLIPGTEYTIQFSIPYTENYDAANALAPQTTFSAWLSTTPFSIPDFNRLQTDNFVLEAIRYMSGTNDNTAFRYSYDSGETWLSASIPLVFSPITLQIAYSGSKYVAFGTYIATASLAGITTNTAAAPTWIEPFYPSGITQGAITNITETNTNLIILGDTIPAGYYSSDGTIWAAIPDINSVILTGRATAYDPTMNRYLLAGVLNPATDFLISTNDLSTGWANVFSNMNINGYNGLGSSCISVLQYTVTNPGFSQYLVGGDYTQSYASFTIGMPIISTTNNGTISSIDFGNVGGVPRLIKSTSFTRDIFIIHDDTGSTPQNDFAVATGSYFYNDLSWSGSFIVSIPDNQHIGLSFGTTWNKSIRPGIVNSIFTDMLTPGFSFGTNWVESQFLKIKNNFSVTIPANTLTITFSNTFTLGNQRSYPYASSLAPGAESSIQIVPYLGLATGIANEIMISWPIIVVGAITIPSGSITLTISSSGNPIISFMGGPFTPPMPFTFLIATTLAGDTGVGYAISKYGNLWVAVGQWTTGTISTSPDGISWSAPFNPTGTTAINPIGRGITYSASLSKWIAAGTWGDASAIAVSSDGLTWSLENPTGQETTTGYDVVEFQSKNYVVGQFNKGGSGTFTLSTDGGATWGKATKVAGSFSKVEIKGIATDGNLFIAVGFWETPALPTYNYKGFARSTDGKNWTLYQPSTLPSDGENYTTHIAWNGSYWLVSGKYTTGAFSTSPDGITWSSPIYITAMGEAQGNSVSDIVWNGSYWLVTGSFEYPIGNSRSFVKSTNGITWTVQENPLGPGGNPLLSFSVASVAWNGSMWVACGTFIDEPAPSNYKYYYFATSTNGENWTLISDQGFIQDYLIPGQMNDITWNGNIWIATGNVTVSGVVYRIAISTDGYKWKLLDDTAESGYIGTRVITRRVQPYEPPSFINGVTALENLGAGTEVVFPRPVPSAAAPQSSPVSFVEYQVGEPWIGNGITVRITNLAGAAFPIFILSGYSSGAQPDPIQLTLENNESTTVTIGYSLGALTTISVRWPSLGDPNLPYIRWDNNAGVQAFDTNVSGSEFKFEYSYPPLPQVYQGQLRGGFLRTYPANSSYGEMTQWYNYLYNTTTLVNTPTFIFTPTQQQMFLTYGTYAPNPSTPVTIKLSFVNPEVPPYNLSPWVGPHFGWTNSLGHAVINEVSFSLGGNLMDTIPGQLMEVLDEFQTPLEKTTEYSNLILRKENGFSQRSYGYTPEPTEVITPLPFWFSRDDPGCYLPIDALYVDEARITVRYRPLTSTYYTDSRVVDASGRAIQTQVEGGSLWPILGSKFYYSDPSGAVVPGLEPIENPTIKVKEIPGIRMPTTLTMGNSYLLVQYIYLDKPEANRFRIADLQIPVVQHYSFDPVDNERNNFVRIPMFIPNPTRDIFFYCQRYTAPGYNAHFLASRDLSSAVVPVAPWWPDASGLAADFYGILRPGFSTRDTEPLRWLALTYEETLVRYSTENVALFRSLVPSIEQRKAPWVNRFYYNLPFGTQNGFTAFSMPIGQANLDKIQRTQLVLGFHGQTGCLTADYVDRYLTRIFAETYNIMRIYGGRGALMFAY